MAIVQFCLLGARIQGSSSTWCESSRENSSVCGCGGSPGKAALTGSAITEPWSIWKRARLLQETSELTQHSLNRSHFTVYLIWNSVKICEIKGCPIICKGFHLDQAVHCGGPQRHSSHEWTVWLVDEESTSQWQWGDPCPRRLSTG